MLKFDQIVLLFSEKTTKLVNVNLPKEPHGICWTHQSVRQYNGKVVESQDPMGRKHYWFSAIPLTEPDESSDRWAVDNGLVSLTPLRVSLTDDEWLQHLQVGNEPEPQKHRWEKSTDPVVFYWV